MMQVWIAGKTPLFLRAMEKLPDALPDDLVALVVDDDSFARNLGRKLLESIGIATVLTAENGADAIIVSNHGGRQLDGAPSSI